ncbi:hypothetical protein ACN42_g8508 [Penicillium freii]|uniref:Uncharacterized protein n=1 Tax=Penicillium freii TaxID=48697 RepID=A0A101MDK5_PENFR|nr:hypothetical protein ACN42_g8508 [Penicillium freii]
MTAFGATSLYHHYSAPAHLGSIVTFSPPPVLPTYPDTYLCRYTLKPELRVCLVIRYTNTLADNTCGLHHGHQQYQCWLRHNGDFPPSNFLLHP